MNYEGGFTKLRIKYDTQKQVDAYEILRQSFAFIAGNNMHTFESSIELEFLDNDDIQLKIFNLIGKKIDKENYTLITKEDLLNYIIKLEHYIATDDFRRCYLGIDETYNAIKKEITILKDLYVSFDWDNDTLLFDYME